jgi:hypothetical protein
MFETTVVSRNFGTTPCGESETAVVSRYSQGNGSETAVVSRTLTYPLLATFLNGLTCFLKVELLVDVEVRTPAPSHGSADS